MEGKIYTSRFEGNRLVAYQDTRGIWTIGVGHKLGADPSWEGTIWTPAQVDAQFDADYLQAQNAATIDVGVVCWSALNEVRQAVLTDMAFNIGQSRLAGFHKMISAILVQDWQNAAAEIMNSDRAKELPKRSQSNATLMLSGEWLDG